MKPVDLTMTISGSMPTFPGSPAPHLLAWSNLEEDGYNLELLFLSSHTGTHMDAPYHFDGKGLKVHQIPISRLVVRATLIRLRKAASAPISKGDILSFEESHGAIPDNASVIFHTDWQKNLKADSYFTENPGLDMSAAEYLVTKRINLVGIDSPSIDLGTDGSFSVHRILARNNVLIVENLTNLHRIRSEEFDLTVLPLKLKGATGSPVRAVGIIVVPYMHPDPSYSPVWVSKSMKNSVLGRMLSASLISYGSDLISP